MTARTRGLDAIANLTPAFRAQDRFQLRNIVVTDTFQRMDHFFWSAQAWLTYRFELMAAFSTFALTVLALYTHVSPGLVAFALSAASTCKLCILHDLLEPTHSAVSSCVVD